MATLTPHEARVLGVLVEKAQTTPAQYPLTLNAVVLACNQKNNRDPVLELTEEEALDALDGLRSKGLAREAMLSGSRVAKYRHVAREALNVSTPELVVLAELLMRGPQSVGELRGRASRMHPFESGEAAQAALDALRSRPEPLVEEVAPAPGQRAPRFAQLLSPGLHPLEAATARERSAPPAAGCEARLARLEEEVAALRAALGRLAAEIGAQGPSA